MGRFSKDVGSGWSPTPLSNAGMGNVQIAQTRSAPKQEDKKEEKPKQEKPQAQPTQASKEPDREAQVQEPVRKTEGGRYDDVDYSELRKAWEE